MTICAVLNKNVDEIYELINNEEIEESRKLVLKLLESEELKDNKDVSKAKKIFNECGNGSKYLSTLVTYMTCIKC